MTVALMQTRALPDVGHLTRSDSAHRRLPLLVVVYRMPTFVALYPPPNPSEESNAPGRGLADRATEQALAVL